MNGRLTSRVASLLALCLIIAPLAMAQTAAARYLGSVTAINGDTLTVKTDAGDSHQIQVPSTAQLKRIAPGQTDLTKADAMEFSSIAVGDRVLVNIDPNATGSTPQALRVVAIKQADVAKKQAAETAAWNQGAHGLVKSIDTGSGTIVVNVRAGAATKPVTVNVSKTTVLKRYAPGSNSFDQAQPAAIDAIKVGDQLWARGTKSADGSSIAADGIVSGSFRSIAGTIQSTDTAGSTITVKDLATKKPVTIRFAADTQMHRLDDRAAQFLAMRLKGGAGGPGGGRPGGAAGAGGGGPRAFGQGGPGGAGGDLESMLDRAPAIQVASLQKNEAVMIVATEDASGISAIKLVAGVEPLLEAPEAQDLLASWSLNQGGGEEAQ